KSSVSQTCSAFNGKAIAFFKKATTGQFPRLSSREEFLATETAPSAGASTSRLCATHTDSSESRKAAPSACRWALRPPVAASQSSTSVMNVLICLTGLTLPRFIPLPLEKLARGHDQRSLSGNINPPNRLNE